METKSFFLVAQEKFGCVRLDAKKNGSTLPWAYEAVWWSNHAEKPQIPVAKNTSLGDQSSTAFPSEAGLVIGFPDIVMVVVSEGLPAPKNPKPLQNVRKPTLDQLIWTTLRIPWMIFPSKKGFLQGSFTKHHFYAPRVYHHPKRT